MQDNLLITATRDHMHITPRSKMTYAVRGTLTFLCLLLSFSLAQAAQLSGTVVRISDGDTVTILDNSKRMHKIRLTGIDAPEKSQPFGDASRKSLAEMIFQKSVEVTFTKYDRYGRILGKIESNGVDICLEQIRRGLAWHYKHYANEQPTEDRLAYAKAEEDARLAKLGLWRDPSPTPPWNFRRQR